MGRAFVFVSIVAKALCPRCSRTEPSEHEHYEDLVLLCRELLPICSAKLLPNCCAEKYSCSIVLILVPTLRYMILPSTEAFPFGGCKGRSQ